MNNIIRVSVLAAVCFVSINAIRWKDCGSAESKIKSVAVAGCETASVCPLKRGENATVTVVFHSNAAFTSAKAVVHGVIAGIPIPFPILNPDGCKDCGLTCPVAANTDDTYSTNIFVKDVYPKVKVIVKWELKDQDGKEIFCMELPAVVTSGTVRNTK